jgi:hypothetical protein
MIGESSSYPTTKHSGVSWLGVIPAHWKISRFKHVAQVKGPRHRLVEWKAAERERTSSSESNHPVVRKSRTVMPSGT